MAEILLRELAIKWWFVVPPVLTNVSALPGETWIPKLSFQSCCIPCFENAASEVSWTCCRLRLLLGRKSVHCIALPVNLQDDRVYAPSNAKKRDIAPERLTALSANVLLVADSVLCCLKTGLHWAVLRQAVGWKWAADTEVMTVEDIARRSSVVFETRYTVWLKWQNFRGSGMPR